MDIFSQLAGQPQLLALLVPAILVALVRPMWAVGWLACVAGTTRALYALQLITTGHKVLLDDGVVLALVGAAVMAAVRRRRLQVTEIGLPALLLLVIAVSSALANRLSLMSVIYGVRFSLLYMFLFLAIRNLPVTPRSVLRLTQLLIGLATLNAVLGLAQFVGLVPQWVMAGHGQDVTGFYRATGLLGDAGNLGCYLVGGVCLALAMAFAHGWETRSRPLWLAGALVMAVVTVMTSSRGPILGLLAGGGLVLYLRGPRRSAVPIAAVLVVVIAVGVVPGVYERFEQIPQEWQQGRTIRAQLFWAGVDVWRKSPWCGVGLGAFGGSAGTYFPDQLAPKIGVYSQIDNFLLGLLVQIGVVGVGLFLWLAVRMARTQLRLVRTREGLPRALATAALGVMVAMPIVSLAGTSLEQHGFAFFFWVLPAMAYSTAALQAARDQVALIVPAAETLSEHGDTEAERRLVGTCRS